MGKKKKRFYFRKNSPYAEANAQEVGEYLEASFPDQNFKPAAIIELARNKKSPIHQYFEWDDTLAAEKYRQRQAQKLIQALYIKIDNVETRAYESVRFTPSASKSYVDIEQIYNDESLFDQVLEKAKSELLFWEKKYTTYDKHLPKVFNAIRELKGAS